MVGCSLGQSLIRVGLFVPSPSTNKTSQSVFLGGFISCGGASTSHFGFLAILRPKVLNDGIEVFHEIADVVQLLETGSLTAGEVIEFAMGWWILGIGQSSGEELSFCTADTLDHFNRKDHL